MTSPEREADAQRRLVQWCAREGAGLARVTGATARVRDRLLRSVGEATGRVIAVMRIEVHPSPSATVIALRDAIAALTAEVVWVVGWEALDDLDAEHARNILAAVILGREAFAALVSRQVWWLGRGIAADRLTQTVDLDDWFTLRLELGRATIPLAVEICFHPEAEEARELALVLDGAFNGVPPEGVAGRLHGMFVPTRLITGVPTGTSFEDAERVVRVVLVTPELSADGAWGEWLEGEEASTNRVGELFLPVVLGDAEWRGTRNALRVSAHSENYLADMLSAVRGLLKGKSHIFVAHTPADRGLGVELSSRLVQTLHARRVLAGETDVPAWANAAILVWPDAAEASPDLRGTLLAILRARLPAVLVDTREHSHAHPFPYTTALPTCRITGSDFSPALQLLAQEQLRHALLTRQLESGAPGSLPLTRPPDLLAAVGLPRASTVLYPDPPLPPVELELLATSGVTFTTPLTRIAPSLKHHVVGLSAGEAQDLGSLTARAYTDARVELARHLLAAGATLAWGGYLGGDGYTDELLRLADEFGQGSFRSYLGWPVAAGWGDRTERALNAEFVVIPRPADPVFASLPEAGGFTPTTPLEAYAWARGMTAVRQRMAAEADARVAIGGRIARSYGGLPGVLEEVLLSFHLARPVFLIGAFGGATRCVTEILLGRDSNELEGAFDASKTQAMQEEFGLTVPRYADIVVSLRSAGIDGLHNGLSTSENEELFVTPYLPRILELILTGLGRIFPPSGVP